MSNVLRAPRAALALRLGVATVMSLSIPACSDVDLDEADDAEAAEQQSGRGGQSSDGRNQGNNGRGGRNDDRDRGNQRDAGQDAAAQQAPAQSTPVRPVGAPVAGSNPEGGFFAAVNASGTGCPAGSWIASISSDGQVFTMTFSSYEISVNSGTQTASKNCVLGLKLQSPRGLQFSLPNIYFSGYAFLEQGVTARQTSNYLFRNGGGVAQPAGALRGPYDRDFVFTSESRTVNDRVWSPCGYDRVVNLNTQIAIQNGNPRASGYVNINAVDGSAPSVKAAASAKVELRLAWRGCKANGPAPTFVDPSVAAVSRSAAPQTTTIDGEQWSTPRVN